ncbi:MAG: GntR family transcriptional regulator [Oscillospiraceae bacterium]
MEFTVSGKSSIPLYTQISENIKKMILDGVLKQGDLLPSVRVLASKLNVSIITTRRVYRDLEDEGYVKSIPAKGTFVSLHHIQYLREKGLTQMEDRLNEAVKIAKMINLSYEDMSEYLKKLYDEPQSKLDDSL